MRPENFWHAIIGLGAASLLSLAAPNSTRLDWQTISSPPAMGVSDAARFATPTWARKRPAFAHRLIELSLPDPTKGGRLYVNPLLRRQPQESWPHWLARMNDYVYRLTDHCEVSDAAAASSRLMEYGIVAAGAVSCGLCHQRAYWLAVLLRNHGLDSRLLGLKGHVVLVVPAESGERHWVLDPDFGTPPFLADLSSAEDMRRSAATRYQFLTEAGWKATYDTIVEAFASLDDNEFYDMKHLAHLAYLQARWIERLWPAVAATTRPHADAAARRESLARALHAALVAAEQRHGMYGHQMKRAGPVE